MRSDKHKLLYLFLIFSFTFLFSIYLASANVELISSKPLSTFDKILNFLGFNIIPITGAGYLDSDRNFISDIYDYVKAQDNNWSETIPSGDYVRAVYERALTNKNDITIYARNKSANASVEIYTKDGTEKIAEISGINGEGLYKTYLTNLVGETDSFDLKSVGDIEYDYITDPTSVPTIYTYVNGTGTNFTVYVYNQTGDANWTAPAGVTSVDYLVIGGGGSGGGSTGFNAYGPGGGGAGGFRNGTNSSIVAGQNYSVSVGSGGASVTGFTQGNNGQNSTFDTITSAGGGGGGYGTAGASGVGSNGGSGGGGGSQGNKAGGSGNIPSTSPSQGNNGGAGKDAASAYSGGGGGGIGSVGSAGTAAAGGNGGAGLVSDITGTATNYSAGGGGASETTSVGQGGSGIGGNGGYTQAAGTNATAGKNATGSGGGGAGFSTRSGAGGSGIVIIRYVTPTGGGGDNPPSVTLSNPSAGYYNDTSQYVNITFNASITDDKNLVNCFLWHNATGTWHLNQTQNVSGTSNVTTFTLNNLNNKTFIWNIQCFDNSSQSSFATSNRTVILNWTDTTPPYFITIPANQSVTYGTGLGVQFNATDSVSFGTYYLGNWTNLFSINSTGYLSNKTSIGVGNYIINVSINDSAENTNMTWYNFTVVKANSSVNLIATTPITYGTTTNFAGSNCPDGSCTLNITNQGYAAGFVTARYSFDGNENYTSSYADFTVTINKATPALNITGTTPITYGAITNVVGGNCPSQLTCTLTPSNGIFGVGVQQFNYSTNGNANYTSNWSAINITINQATSLVYAYINNSRANFTSSSGNNIWLNATLQNGTGNIYLYLNGTLINSGNSPISNLTNLSDGFYNLTATYLSTQNYSASSETWWINVTTAPFTIQNSPTNGSYFNNQYFSILNATVYDDGLSNMTIRFYGDGNLINTQYNIVNGTSVIYNWTNLAIGIHNWTVIADDTYTHSPENNSYFNIINLTITCDGDGPYLPGAKALIYGDVSDGKNAINNNLVNIEVYKNNILNNSITVNTSCEGTYLATYPGLNTGIYVLNVNTTYLGFEAQCTDSFNFGGTGSLLIVKTASLNSINETDITYNVTLRVRDIGQGPLSNISIQDTDSPESPYFIPSLSESELSLHSYLISYPRNSVDYNVTLATASANALDIFSGNVTYSNSSRIIMIVPAATLNASIVLIKNIYLNSENTTMVNYTTNIEVVNSGGVDLSGITVLDSDLELNTLINLNKTQMYNYSKDIIISKAASNTEKTFVKTTATVDTTTYESNQIKIIIPGYGGPADTYVYSPESISQSTSFDSIIKVKNLNNDIGQNFIIDYWITDEAETVNYSSGQATVYVAALGETNTTITLISPSSAGTYRLRALVSYIGGPDTAYDSFSVTTPQAVTQTTAGTGGGTTAEVIKEIKVDEIVCNIPYIRFEKGCCLDSNNNSICDKDEILITSQKENKTKEEEKPIQSSKEKPSLLDNIRIGLLNILESPSKLIKNIFENKRVLLILILVGLAILVLLTRRKLGEFFGHISEKFNCHKYLFNSIEILINKKVYSGNGDYLGIVRDVILSGNSINSLNVELDSKYHFKAKGVAVHYDSVVSVGEIVILRDNILESLLNYKII